jgi:hypothetical protein
MKTKKILKQIILLLFCMIACLLQSSCGMVAVMTTPTRYEEEIPAEYKLTNLEDKKVLVFVKQPYWLDSKVNLRVHLTDAIHEQLIKNTEVSPDKLIGYDKLSKYRSGRADFSLLKPSDIGKALGADVVFYVNITEAQLENMPDTDIYKSFLSAKAYLIDTASGSNLWPEQSDGKSIKVGFDMEEKGMKAAISRLSRSTAHCIVRYLYDCKLAYFKTGDDKSGPAWEYWE